MDDPMHDGPTPLLKAMLLCEKVIIEHGTYKKSLIGIFDGLLVDDLPALVLLSIYVCLMDVEGQRTVATKFWQPSTLVGKPLGHPNVARAERNLSA